jgi:hypothetical protein
MPVPSMIRTRWAALGAAVAVSLGAGGVSLISATSPGGAAAFVPITPCRLFDTRPAPHTVGGRTSPLGPDETYDVAARGTQGNCALPTSAVGIVLNVTAVDATQATFLTLFPSGADRPTASHLNPSPGAPPAPNAVTVDLSDAGEFSVFNRFGSVHVLADVVGYYTDHHHDDRYYTQAQADATVAAAVDAALDEAPARRQTVVIPGGSTAQAYGGSLIQAPDGWASVSGGAIAMSFPLEIPAGSTIRSITYTYRDNDSQDISFSLSEAPLPTGDTVNWAEFAFQTSGATPEFRAGTLEGLAFVVKPAHNYQLWAWRSGVTDWPNDLMAVKAITVEYDLP